MIGVVVLAVLGALGRRSIPGLGYLLLAFALLCWVMIWLDPLRWL